MELRRADDSLVGASKVRSVWSSKMDSFASSGSESVFATSKISTNSKLKVHHSSFLFCGGREDRFNNALTASPYVAFEIPPKNVTP